MAERGSKGTTGSTRSRARSRRPEPEPEQRDQREQWADAVAGFGAAAAQMAGVGAGACPVALCPVSMAMTAAGSVSPEVVEHLLAAGRELLLAAKAVVDARAAAATGGAEADGGLQKIVIE